ncbi:hypothetical protein MVEG_05869 [Podila verticillata NRRL 6337]|nr:hypothetical protein MVEG_05869 [Podila verticillata NRRL 6337]
MSTSPVLIVLIGSALAVSLACGFFYWRRQRRDKKERRNMRTERRKPEHQHHYLIPHMHEEDHINNARNSSNSTAPLTAHENRSNRQIHLLSNNTQQPTIYLSGNGSSQHNRSNPSNINLALNSENRHDSVDAKLIRSRSSPNPDIPVIFELSALPPIHPTQSTAGKRTYPKPLPLDPGYNNLGMFSERNPSMDDLRIDDMRSTLPRPLHLQRPVVADSIITSSTKVVANIIRSPSPSGSFMRRSPSPGLRIVASVPEMSPSPLAKQETQRPRKPSKPDPVAPSTPMSTNATTKKSGQCTELDSDPDLVTLPVHQTEDDPFMSKEELRNGPQALLTANLHNLVNPATSQLTIPTLTDENLLVSEEVEMMTAHLVLMPYLNAQTEPNSPLASPVPAPSVVSASTAATIKVELTSSPSSPKTPEKSPKRNSFRKNEGDQQQPQQQGSLLASIQESYFPPTTATAPKSSHSHHYPNLPPIATKTNTGASDSGTTSTSPPPSSRKPANRTGFLTRDSSASSLGSSTTTMVGTPTTPRSPPVPSTPPPVPVPPPVYASAFEGTRSQVATYAARAVSPSPSNTSSNISSGLSIISSTYSTAPSSGSSVSPMGSTTNVNCTASPTIYSPATPGSIYSPITPSMYVSSGMDSATIRSHAGKYDHDEFLKKYFPPTGIIQKRVDGEEDHSDTIVGTELDDEENDGSGWSYKAARGNEKRVNHPQAPEGAGARFSQFNFQTE